MGLAAHQYSRPNERSLSHRVTLNVVQSCVDTAAAKIAKNKPKISFLTEGGNPKAQRRAKGLEKFVAGQFYAMGVHETTPMCFLDAAVLEVGLYKVYRDKNRICGERTIPTEIMVDDTEAFYGAPRSLYQGKLVDRDILKESFPSFKREIDVLKNVYENAGFGGGSNYADLVLVSEAWRLPSGKDSGDGKHAICIEGADLLADSWERDRFPFAKYVWNPKLFGFYGQSIPGQILGIQLEINKILRAIQIAHHLLSAPAVYIEKGSDVISAHINNEIGRIIKFKGTIPQVVAHQTINPEIYQHLERLYARAFEIVGISQLSSQSVKPAGLDSGKALREYNDIESERFIQAGQRWEQFHLDIADLIIDEGKEIAKDDPSFCVMSKGQAHTETIKFKEVDLERDKYMMQSFPKSGLSGTLSDRLAEVQEMMTSGLIDPEEGLELMDFPDLQAHKNTRFAPRKLIKDIVERILETGEMTQPEPFFDLAYAVQYGSLAYSRAKLDNVEEEHLEILRRFIELSQHFLNGQQPTEPQGQPAALASPADPMMSQGLLPPGTPGVGEPMDLPTAPLMPAQ